MSSDHLELGAANNSREVLFVLSFHLLHRRLDLQLARNPSWRVVIVQVEVRERGAQRKSWQAHALMGCALGLTAIVAFSTHKGSGLRAAVVRCMTECLIAIRS